MRAFFALTGKSFQRAIAYRVAFWTELVINFCFMYLNVCLWQALTRDSGAVAGYQPAAMLTYVIVAQTILTLQFTVRVVWEVEARVRTGAIAYDLLRPVDFQTAMLATSLGPALHTLLFNMIPKILVFAAAGLVAPPPSAAAALAFTVSLILGFFVQFGIEVLVGLSAFWLIEIQGVHAFVVWGLSWLCSGYFLPLDLYPDWLAAIARALPFQAIVYTPSAIWVGRISGGAVLIALAQQAAWAAALLLGGRALFGAARRRLVVQGG